MTPERWFTMPRLIRISFKVCLLGLFVCQPGIFAADSTNAPPIPTPRFDAKAIEKQMLDDWVIRTATDNDPEYTRTFTELGLKPEDSDRFKARLAALHQKAIAAGGAMQQLIEA